MGSDFSIPEHHTHIELKNLDADLSSGDIVLFSGKGSMFSEVVRILQSPLKWTHVGVIVRDPKTNVLHVFQSTYEKKPMNYYHGQEGDSLKSGPKLTPLHIALADYNGYAIAFRKLTYPLRNIMEERKKIEQKFWNHFEIFWNQHGHKKYKQNPFELLGAAYSMNTISNDSSLFCSELIAKLFITIGLLPLNWMLTNNVNMWHFSDISELPFQSPFQLSPEIYLYHQY